MVRESDWLLRSILCRLDGVFGGPVLPSLWNLLSQGHSTYFIRDMVDALDLATFLRAMNETGIDGTRTTPR